MTETRLELGSIYAVSKPEFDQLLLRLKAQGFETIGPMVQDNNLVYAPIESLQDLPKGFVSEQ